MLNVTILCVGNLKESYLREAVREYEKRLSAYCKTKTIELKDSEPISPHLSEKAFRIALCVEGQQLSSEELATLIDKKTASGYSELMFIIGGFNGLPDEVKQASHLRLSFSKMTFPHQLMRVILYEQIYRALNILAGGKYHK